MRNIFLIILIFISLLCFAGLIVITIKASTLPSLVKTVGFIVLGYISIILFSYSWFKIFKK